MFGGLPQETPGGHTVQACEERETGLELEEYHRSCSQVSPGRPAFG